LRAKCVRGRARLFRQRGRRDRDEERARVDAPGQLDQEPRMVGQEHQPVLVPRDLLDQAKMLGPLELRLAAPRIITSWRAETSLHRLR
jgi:hypothetical protein